MRYLVDANVWLDAILGRAQAADAVRLLDETPPGLLATTDFALHSVGIYVARGAPNAYRAFLDDPIKRNVSTLHLPPSLLYTVLDVMHQHSLKFDDAFQYVAAERFDLTIVSQDADFDRTPRGRKTPAQVLAELGAAPPSP